MTSQSCYVFNAAGTLARSTQHEGFETLYYSSAHGTAFAPCSGTDTRVKTQTTLLYNTRNAGLVFFLFDLASSFFLPSSLTSVTLPAIQTYSWPLTAFSHRQQERHLLHTSDITARAHRSSASPTHPRPSPPLLPHMQNPEYNSNHIKTLFNRAVWRGWLDEF